MINEGEFAADYELVPVLPEADPASRKAPLTAKLPEPVPDDELEYQPGFAPLTEEDKKRKAEEDKKRAEKKAADEKKRAEDKAAADKKQAAADKKEASASIASLAWKRRSNISKLLPELTRRERSRNG